MADDLAKMMPGIHKKLDRQRNELARLQKLVTQLESDKRHLLMDLVKAQRLLEANGVKVS
jgi:hypothetical protein